MGQRGVCAGRGTTGANTQRATRWTSMQGMLQEASRGANNVRELLGGLIGGWMGGKQSGKKMALGGVAVDRGKLFPDLVCGKMKRLASGAPIVLAAAARHPACPGSPNLRIVAVKAAGDAEHIVGKVLGLAHRAKLERLVSVRVKATRDREIQRVGYVHVNKDCSKPRIPTDA